MYNADAYKRGMSSQLAFKTSIQSYLTDLPIKEGGGGGARGHSEAPPVHFCSLRTDLLGAIAEARKVGVLEALGRYDDRLYHMFKHQHQPSPSALPLPRLRGTFVVVELIGAIGKEAGLGDRLVPKREAVQLLAQVGLAI